MDFEAYIAEWVLGLKELMSVIVAIPKIKPRN